MAMYNSFYGGRRGTSFVIVKNYLDIPQMVNAFSQGNDCTEVNFEEYVIINNPNKNHPDNGKIFRRGYDFNSNRTISGYVFYANADSTKAPIILSSEVDYRDKLENKEHYSFEWRENIQAHGAEYVGTIIGPAGKAPLLTLGSYEQVQNKSQTGFEQRRSRGHYSPVGDTQSVKEEEQSLADWEQSSEESINTISLIPGKDENGFHDSIEWYCVSVRNDDYGDDTQAYIGFKFPYLVTQMQTQQVSPYDRNGNIADMSDIARVEDDLSEHPYYNKWHLKIPKGVPGDALRNLRITTFNEYSGNATNSDEKGPLYYCVKDSGETIKQKLIYFDEHNEGHFNRQFFEEKYGTDIVSEGITLIELLNKLTDKAILVYEKYNFDNKQNGEVEYYYLGDYNEIESISLSRDGRLICTLTHDGEEILNTDRIKWIASIGLDVPELVTIEPSTIIEEGEQIVIPGSTYIDFKDDVTKNLTVTYNEGSVNEFNIPFVKRILYDDNTGGLYYQLAGIHSGEDENGNIDGVHLTTLEYVENAQYDQALDKIIFYKNSYVQGQADDGDRKIEIPVPAIKAIKIENRTIDEVSKPCLIAQYHNKDSEIIAVPFDYLESFNYDDSDGSLNYKKKSGNNIEKHIIPFVDKLQYDDDTAQIRYHVNGAEETQYEELEGNLPIIKNFAIDDSNKEILIQFGTEFNAFKNISNYIPTDTITYPPTNYWYRIGSTISDTVVMGGILTNYNLFQINELLRNHEPSLPEISEYRGAESYSENENPIINALNSLYPNGYISGQDTSLRVVTFGEENANKEYYAYNWLPIRTVQEGDEVVTYGTWYFLGSIKAINNVNLSQGDSGIAHKEGSLSFVSREDICLITIIDNTSGCRVKNTMTKIQSNHRYTNTITGPVEGVVLKVGSNTLGNNYVTISPNQQATITIPENLMTSDLRIEINGS